MTARPGSAATPKIAWASYMWIQAGAEVGVITATDEGATFFVIELPMLADIAAEQAGANDKRLLQPA